MLFNLLEASQAWKQGRVKDQYLKGGGKPRDGFIIWGVLTLSTLGLQSTPTLKTRATVQSPQLTPQAWRHPASGLGRPSGHYIPQNWTEVISENKSDGQVESAWELWRQGVLIPGSGKILRREAYHW